jgi:NAD(P)H-dependent flavin oxidoreductase YrpB (nitropropane dioxygenase family)
VLRFDLVALTAPASLDPSIAIAANRAGEHGGLDLEYARDLQEALFSLARLVKHAEGAGVKLAVEAAELTSDVIAALPEAVNLVVLVPDDVAATRSHVETLRARADSQGRQIEVWLETTSAQEARLGERLGVDGLVAKGHEAGGRVADETAFVLMQRLLKQSRLPVWVHGGIGLHTAAACYAAGGAGVVLDSQLLLTREMSLDETQREVLRQMDGSETQALEVNSGQYVRVCARANLSPVQALRARLEAHQALNEADQRHALFETLGSCAGWGAPDRDVWLLGQDGAFAAPLAERFRTVSGVLSGFRAAVKEHAEAAAALRPLDEGSPLARSHGTRYPIVQGPMTRVSDRAAFAAQVAEAGGLPFLALALMRRPAVQALLLETQELLGEQPFGVGILGFVPMDLREEQLAAIRAVPPAFALIAGGRPDQALALEGAGTPTYLHVPSPGLLRLFASAGARRFVFEGRECGGHVGPRSSFVLWNQAIETLLDALSVEQIADCHILFAGGIHDSTSALAVAAMTAPLAQFGAKVGVLMGTPYLFTAEAVTSGAILPGFQNEALSCDATVLLESGPGHATRCAMTPFATTFAGAKRRLLAQGISGDELRAGLEDLNLGRLRLASKGVRRADVVDRANVDPDAGPERLLAVGEEEQRADGMYMIGQVAGLRDSLCSVVELHHEVSVESSERLTHIASELREEDREKDVAGPPPKSRPSRIAIVGMSCILPQAPDLQTYWSNILNSSIRSMPSSRCHRIAGMSNATSTPTAMHPTRFTRATAASSTTRHSTRRDTACRPTRWAQSSRCSY